MKINLLKEKLVKGEEQSSEVSEKLSAQSEELGNVVIALKLAEETCSEKMKELEDLNLDLSSCNALIEDLNLDLNHMKVSFQDKDVNIDNLLSEVTLLRGDNAEKVLAMSEKEEDLTGQISQLHKKLTGEQEALADIFENFSNKSLKLEEILEEQELMKENLAAAQLQAASAMEHVQIVEREKDDVEKKLNDIVLSFDSLCIDNHDKDLQLVSLNIALIEKEEELKKLEMMFHKADVLEDSNEGLLPCVVGGSAIKCDLASNEVLKGEAGQIESADVTVPQLRDGNETLREEDLKLGIEETQNEDNTVEHDKTILSLESENKHLQFTLKEFKAKASKKFKEKMKESKEKENVLTTKVEKLECEVLRQVQNYKQLYDSYKALKEKLEPEVNVDIVENEQVFQFDNGNSLLQQTNYESELNDMRVKMEEKENEILTQHEEYNVEILELNESLASIRSELQQAEEELSKSDEGDQLKKKDLLFQYQELADENENLSNMLQQRDDEIYKLAEKMNEVESEMIAAAEMSVQDLSILGADVDSLGQRLIESNIMLQEKDDELTDRESSLQAFVVQVESLKQELNCKIGIIDVMETGLRLTNAELIEVGHKLKDYEGIEIDGLKSTDDHINNLTDELYLRKKLIAQMSDEHDELKTEFETQSGNFIKELATCHEKNTKLEEELTENNQKVNLLNDRLKVKELEFVAKESELIATLQELERKLETAIEKKDQHDNALIEKENCEHKMLVLRERFEVKKQELRECEKNYISQLEKLQEKKVEVDEALLLNEGKYEDLLNELNAKEAHFLESKSIYENIAEDLKQVNTVLQSKVDVLHSSLDERNTELSMLKSTIEEFYLKDCSQKEEIITINNNLETIRVEYETQYALNSLLENELKEHKHTAELSIDLLNDSLLNTNDELLSTKEELAVVSENLRLRKTLVASMENESNMLKEELSNKDTQMELFELSVNEEKDKSIRQVTDELNQLKSTLIRYESKLANANMEVKVKHDSVKLKDLEFQEQIQAFEKELQEKNNTIVVYKQDSELLQADITNMNDERGKLLMEKDVKIEDLTFLLDQIQSACAVKEAELMQFNENESIRLQEMDNKRKELIDNMDSNYFEEPAVQELIEQISQQDVDIKVRKKMISISDTQLQEAKQEIESLNVQVSNLSNDLEKTKAELSTLNLELAGNEIRQVEEINETITPVNEFVTESSVPLLFESYVNDNVESSPGVFAPLAYGGDLVKLPVDSDEIKIIDIQQQFMEAPIADEGFQASASMHNDAIQHSLNEELEQYKRWIQEYQDNFSAKELENEEHQLKFEQEKAMLT